MQILLTDVPGTGGLEGRTGPIIAVEEAQRAQLVLFVCDGDLTRNESQAVKWLLALGKPLILVMNKSDRYSREEQAVLMERLLDHLGELGGEFERDQVLAVSAGGEVDVVERKKGWQRSYIKGDNARRTSACSSLRLIACLSVVRRHSTFDVTAQSSGWPRKNSPRQKASIGKSAHNRSSAVQRVKLLLVHWPP